MRAFRTVSGAAAPLLLDNVDTDVIIRMSRLTSVKRTELGPYALETLRLLPDGSENPECVLNQPAFRGAPILLAGRNFGCGSSREGAVWALDGSGVRCIIASGFGDIFHANCLQNGVLPIDLPPDQVAGLARQAAGGSPLTIDLEQCLVQAPDGSRRAFTIDPLKRVMLLQGVDELTLTLGKRALIDAWRARDRAARPWLWQTLADRPASAS